MAGIDYISSGNPGMQKPPIGAPSRPALCLDSQYGALYASINGIWQQVSAAVGATDEFEQFMASLQEGRSTTMFVIGDSTGAGTQRWVYLLSQWLAQKFPAYTVRYRAWDGGIEDYDAPVFLQMGPLGERFVNTSLTNSNYTIMQPTEIPAITGGVDLRIKIAPDSWRSTNNYGLLSQGTGSAPNLGFEFYLAGTGAGSDLFLTWSPDGTSTVTARSTAGVPDAGAGNPQWLRVVHVWDNGSNQNTAVFYTSLDGVTWTKLGNTVTNSGTTSYNTSTAATAYWGFGNAYTGLVLNGKVFWAEIRNGNNVILNPPQPDQWEFATGSSSAPSYGGSPTIDILNGSEPGAGLAYFADATRGPKVMLNFRPTLAIFSLNHNEQAVVGAAEQTSYVSLLATIRSTLPAASIVLLSQNPRIPPAANDYGQLVRTYMLSVIASTYGYGFVDLRRVFDLNPLGLTALIDSDGVHPSNASGSPLWAQTIEFLLMQAAQYV